MAVLITGGTGFLGSFLARELCDRGERPILMDLRLDLTRLRGYEDRVDLVEGNVTSWADLAEVFKTHEIDAVVHTAADLSLRAERSRIESFRTNVEATLNVLELSRMFDVDRVVFTSSLSVFGLRSMPVSETSFRDPATFYGVTKACSEIVGSYYASSHGLDFSAVRFPIITGPYRRGEGASVTISSLIDSAVLEGKGVVRLPLETRIPLLYVRDAARLLRLLISHNGKLRDIYIVGGVVVSVGELVSSLKRVVPDAIVENEVDDASMRIAGEWAALTELALRERMVERFGRIEDVGWQIEFDSAEKMVKDHVETLKREVGA
ncbi:Nucleoside-diphosphate-sugar epimerase [Geoglobus ahangari]|uniref:Nucleoside-diphosphate-sugar epimerase n=1 Tax=Geoglobus ahangari TaxID=113653 RepID=A0A0F7IHU2_9EURY|nr:NAD(P)-dependent oxidoreductase [Geoglobus ahangari]AKG92318.1 Nucleoside-diphosphate-sugar epimerase [Geoglobus ahangari]